MSDDALLTAALGYAERGWRVFPCHNVVLRPGGAACSCALGADCAHKAKHPRTYNGCHDASAQPSVVRGWWQRWPLANIGLATGKVSDLLVLDVDPRNGGDATLAALEDENGALPPTRRAITGGGGQHIFFRNVPGPTRGKLGPGLDLKGDGGLVIVAPSLHASGRRYAWANEMPVAEAPGWLAQLIRRESAPAVGATGTPASCAVLSDYGEAALMSAAEKIMEAPNGEQEATLNRECFSIGSLAGAGGVPVDLALDVLLTAARAMPDFDPRRPWRPRDLEWKVRRAFGMGLRSPRVDRAGVEREIARLVREANDAS